MSFRLQDIGLCRTATKNKHEEKNKMKSIFKTKFDWTKLVIVSALFCLMFGFNVLAQASSEKPLDAKSLNVLVAELKGVVSSTEHDEKNAALVGEKWDGRRDLAGKTKKEVINLLYMDV